MSHKKPPNHIPYAKLHFAAEAARPLDNPRVLQDDLKLDYDRLGIPRPLVRTHSFAELTPDPLPWLIPSLLPRGELTLLVGPPSSGKSFFALALAAHLCPSPPGERVAAAAAG